MSAKLLLNLCRDRADTFAVTVQRGRRFNPMSGSLAMVFVDVGFALAIVACCKYMADRFQTPLSQWLVFMSAAGLSFLVLIGIPLRILLLEQREEAEEHGRGLREQLVKQEFDAQLVRALDMVDDEDAALAITTRALAQGGSDIGGHVLFADSSDAHLQTVAVVNEPGRQGHCDVATPRGCPAIRNAHTLNFPDSMQLDTCPHLFERSALGLTALCVPVSIVGRATGVVHVTRAGAPFAAAEQQRIESVARQAGQRVGMLRATAQSHLQANTDSLTGLLNRRSIESEVRQLVKQHVPYAVAILDLDHFKMLNDTYGHETGDRALRLFARTLRETVRATDIVSRHGGEEFVVVFPHAVTAEAVAVLDRVRLELAASLGDGRAPTFTMSGGVAESSEGVDHEAVLAVADERLLAAKRAGRDRVFSESAAEGAATACDASQPTAGRGSGVTLDHEMVEIGAA
jgi:diguanylate cyclase (GGDEF)-like protein